MKAEVAIAVAGVAALGGLGYWVWRENATTKQTNADLSTEQKALLAKLSSLQAQAASLDAEYKAKQSSYQALQAQYQTALATEQATAKSIAKKLSVLQTQLADEQSTLSALEG